MKLSGKEPWNYTGTITVTAGGANIVGSGTAFDERMVGAVSVWRGPVRRSPAGTGRKESLPIPADNRQRTERDGPDTEQPGAVLPERLLHAHRRWVLN